MTDRVYAVVTEFGKREDAEALRDLIREIGFEAVVQRRTLDAGPRTPCRDTRLGRAVLRFMLPVEGASPRSFTTEDVATHVETLDYEAVSASPALSTLAAQGDVRRISAGLYILTSAESTRDHLRHAR